VNIHAGVWSALFLLFCLSFGRLSVGLVRGDLLSWDHGK
jgi:hypothetical protein